jgi:hypothetical protein
VLANWQRLRSLAAVECDADVDSGFATAVRNFYADVAKMLDKGARSEAKMAKAKRRAGVYVARRCFLEVESGVTAIVEAVAAVRELVLDRELEDWLAGSLESRRPAPAPAAPGGEVEVISVVEDGPAPRAEVPEPPKYTGERAALERAADRLYGPPRTDGAAAAAAAPKSERAPEPEPESEPTGEQKETVERMLCQLTLVKFMQGWELERVVQDLLDNEVFEGRSDAEEFVEGVIDKLCDPEEFATVFTPGQGESAETYAKTAESAVGREYQRVEALVREGRSREEILADVGTRLHLPERAVDALVRMAEASSPERKAQRLRLFKMLAVSLLSSKTREDFDRAVADLGMVKEEAVPLAHKEAVASLTDVGKVREIDGATCDQVVDLGYITLVCELYSEITEILGSGSGQESLQRALDHVCRRCFLEEEMTASEIVAAAAQVDVLRELHRQRRAAAE